MKLKENWKYIRKILVAGILLIAILTTSQVFSTPVEAASYTSRYAWKDGTGNIIFSTRDRLHTSSYTYKTIGITLSRCVAGKMERSPNGEYITFAFSADFVEEEIKDSGDGYIESIYTIPEAELLARVAAYYPDWLAELQSGKTTWVVIDSVMCCATVENGNRTQHGLLIDDGSRVGVFIDNTYWNTKDMFCNQCGGNIPCLMDGFIDNIMVTSDTQICFGHGYPNVKEGH